MPVALPLTSKLANSCTKQTAFRTLKAQFGDGYSQRAADGTNATIDSWSITWEYLSSDDKDTIVSALNSVGGWDYLTWTPFGEATSKKFVLKEGSYSITFSEGGTYFNISTGLIQVFDV